MGWVEIRPGRKPRACWRPTPGELRRVTCEDVAACEELLQREEGDFYLPPSQRKGGRPPVGSRGHTPSLTQYVKKGCRCTRCKAIYAANKAEQRERAKQRLAQAPEEFVHGSATTYALGCKCEPCAAAGKKKNDTRKKESSNE